MNVLRFLFKRALWGLVTVWVVYTASFFLMRSAPGGPFAGEKKLPAAIKRNIERRYKLDQPLSAQYVDDLMNRLRLDFGPCYKLEDFTVNELIAQGFPVSASLGVLALLFALTLGITAGVFAAVYYRTWLDFTFMLGATLGIAVPNFVLASVSVLVVVIWLHWLPAGGWGTISQLVLPAICLGMPYAAYIARLTRTGMLEVLGNDYIRTARAKGLPAARVYLRHALRASLLPVISFVGPATAGILTGSLVIERIFNLPGMGSHFIESALQLDYTVALGMVIVYTVLLYIMNMLVDLAYVVLDPRISLE